MNNTIDDIKLVEKSITIPENIRLNYKIADLSTRISAAAIDFFFFSLIHFFILVIGTFLKYSILDPTVQSIAFIILLGLRLFWFIYFENSWRRATPGKKALNIRVISATGEPLTAKAIVARNLTRELEMSLPFTFIFFDIFSLGIPMVVIISLAVWSFTLLLIPLINKNNQRLGDIIGGTIVVEVPKRTLLQDMVKVDNTDRYYGFTKTQLSAYGIKELKVLEKVIRLQDGVESAKTKAEVAKRIRSKINAQDSSPDAEFLQNFYSGFRAYLEEKKTIGKAKKDKYDSIKSDSR